jgi:hypothetical protein
MILVTSHSVCALQFVVLGRHSTGTAKSHRAVLVVKCVTHCPLHLRCECTVAGRKAAARFSSLFGISLWCSRILGPKMGKVAGGCRNLRTGKLQNVCCSKN